MRLRVLVGVGGEGRARKERKAYSRAYSSLTVGVVVVRYFDAGHLLGQGGQLVGDGGSILRRAT
jgi:hypothetical protein